MTTPNEVIVIYGSEVVRIPIKAWQHIMANTGQMRDAWFEDAKERGENMRVAKTAYNAFDAIAALFLRIDMTTPNEALKQALLKALDALKVAASAKLADGTYLDKDCKMTLAITALQAAIALPVEPTIKREELANFYVWKSGKAAHASDCATSTAPALMPGPCDCDYLQPTSAVKPPTPAMLDPALGTSPVDVTNDAPRTPLGLLLAIQRAGLTLLKNQYGYELIKAEPTAQPVAIVIKTGADRQFMSERLGDLPDGTYSLYLATPPPVAGDWLKRAEHLCQQWANAARDDIEDYRAAKQTALKHLRTVTVAPPVAGDAGWQPIETAPKDGTEIILCAAATHDQGICYWRDDEVMTGWTWGMGKHFRNPVYWMPRRSPPIAAAIAAGVKV